MNIFPYGFRLATIKKLPAIPNDAKSTVASNVIASKKNQAEKESREQELRETERHNKSIEESVKGSGMKNDDNDEDDRIRDIIAELKWLGFKFI